MRPCSARVVTSRCSGSDVTARGNDRHDLIGSRERRHGIILFLMLFSSSTEIRIQLPNFGKVRSRSFNVNSSCTRLEACDCSTTAACCVFMEGAAELAATSDSLSARVPISYVPSKSPCLTQENDRALCFAISLPCSFIRDQTNQRAALCLNMHDYCERS